MVVFFFGSHTELSKAELSALIDTSEYSDFTTFRLYSNLSSDELNAVYPKLGGCPRAGVVVAETEELSEEIIAEAISKACIEASIKKIMLSDYSGQVDKRAFLRSLKPFKINYEGNFQERIHSPVSSFYLKKKGGAEFTILPANNKFLLVRITAMQDPKYWGDLDYEKPARDMKIGMMPAKLATIMVNLAAPASTIYDPFCGTGTILMLSIKLGKRIIGSDISSKSMEIARKNIKWINKNMSPELFVSDISELNTRRMISKGIDAIVTEPFLGNIMKRPYPNLSQAEREWRSIEKIYQSLLEKSANLLVSGQKLVFIKPNFRYFTDKVSKWYNPTLPVNNSTWSYPEWQVKPLVWENKDSLVAREIVVLSRK